MCLVNTSLNKGWYVMYLTLLQYLPLKSLHHLTYCYPEHAFQLGCLSAKICFYVTLKHSQAAVMCEFVCACVSERDRNREAELVLLSSSYENTVTASTGRHLV